ncbi:MAG: Ig-like domain-containing protein [Bacteroidetes bacterium]|nr:Ig-like domain-containing protein [Bacteroidota bacterium]
MRKEILIILGSAILIWQCARQGQPAGGPKDVDAPTLISSNPTNGQKNFTGNNITLLFDEYVKLKDPKEEIIINPTPGANTKYLVKKKTVTIIPEYPWRANTTYSIAFRNGIQDINESNPAEDLHLAFSTGSTIDSLSIHGQVTEVFKEKPPEKLLVALYQSDTFNIFQDRPVYFTKTSKTGDFSINNLKEGKYYVYAFEDKNKNTKVDSKTEVYGFLPNAIDVPQNSDTLRIPLVHLDARPLKLSSTKNTSSISIIRFNKPIDSVNIVAKKNAILYTYGDNFSEIFVYKNFSKEDSLKIQVYANDSLKQKIDTSVFVKFTDGKIPTEKFRIDEWNVTIHPKNYELVATTRASKIITKINTDSIYFQLDTINYQSVKKEEITFDTLKKIISLKTKLNINPKEKKPKPILLSGKGSFISIDNDSSKSQDVKIEVPTLEGTGVVSIEIKTKEKHYQVKMVSADNKIQYSFRDLPKHTFNFVKPTDYKIFIIIDRNNNHRWDPGNFYKKEMVEKVILYKSIEGKFTFPVRANWEIGPLLITF